MASNPMQQFSVHKIGPEIKIAGVDLSFTNASLFMVISASLIVLFLFLGTKEKKIGIYSYKPYNCDFSFSFIYIYCCNNYWFYETWI